MLLFVQETSITVLTISTGIYLNFGVAISLGGASEKDGDWSGPRRGSLRAGFSVVSL